MPRLLFLTYANECAQGNPSGPQELGLNLQPRRCRSNVNQDSATALPISCLKVLSETYFSGQFRWNNGKYYQRSALFLSFLPKPRNTVPHPIRRCHCSVRSFLSLSSSHCLVKVNTCRICPKDFFQTQFNVLFFSNSN